MTSITGEECLGFGLLQDAIQRAVAVAEHAGTRAALLTHTLDAEAEAFCWRFSFEPIPDNARALILLLKDARRFAAV